MIEQTSEPGPYNRGALSNLIDRFSAQGRRLLLRYVPFGPAQSRPSTSVVPVDAMTELARTLLSVRGEASGVAIATDLLALYERSEPSARHAFFLALAEQFNPDPAGLLASWNRYQTEGACALPELAEAVEAPRQELFRRLNLAPLGTQALVRMRADLLGAIKKYPELKVVDVDLIHLLRSWFNRGFLTLRPITWSSPASLLERIIRYEAVHNISSWADLRSRIDPEDRRCFAFFHPAMPDEPLIFVEVALTLEMADSIQALLAADRPVLPASSAEMAIFYSISNCQPGLHGISFGHFLIKQVAGDLKRELPGLSRFATLSPVPGLMPWLRSTTDGPEQQALVARLEDGSEDPAAQAFLMRRTFAYFMEERRANGMPLDPVARFHLGNGARLERINWRGDLSANGLRQSAGVMVNYLYDLQRIEEYHEAYANRHEVIVGPPIREAAKALSSPTKSRKR